jgi:hypothetical protein
MNHTTIAAAARRGGLLASANRAASGWARRCPQRRASTACTVYGFAMIAAFWADSLQWAGPRGRGRLARVTSFR